MPLNMYPSLSSAMGPTDKTTASLSGQARGAAGADGQNGLLQTYAPLDNGVGGIAPVAPGAGVSKTPASSPPSSTADPMAGYFDSPYWNWGGNFSPPVPSASPAAVAGAAGGTRPSAQATPPTPGLNAATPNANNPFGSSPLMTNPTGSNPLSGGTIPYNSQWYATPDAAATLARMTGGTVIDGAGASGISNNQSQWMVQLPNGQVVYPGAIASLYTDPVTSGNQSIIDTRMAEMLNNNAVGSTDIAHQGLYTVKNGAISYDPNGQALPTTSTPISMSQYNAWLTRNALAGATGYGNGNQPQTGNWSTLLGSPGTGAPAVTGAPNAAQLADLQRQYGVTPQAPHPAPAPQPSAAGPSASDPLSQLAQFFALFSGPNTLNQQQQSSPDAQFLQVLQLIMALSGGQQPGDNALYSRSQYPRFP